MQLWLIFSILMLSFAAHAQEKAPTSRTAAQRLDRAHVFIHALDYLQAIDELNDVISDPSATEDELVMAHLWAGIVTRVMEDNVDARLHFNWVLKRRPKTKLPPGQPPKVAILYEMIRDDVDVGEEDSKPAVDPQPTVAPAPEIVVVTPAPPEKEAAPIDAGAVQSSEANAIPWFTIAGGSVAAAGLVVLTVGAGTWGAGLAMVAIGNDSPDQVSALAWSAPSLAAQIAGQIIVPIALAVVVGGAAVGAFGLLAE